MISYSRMDQGESCKNIEYAQSTSHFVWLPLYALGMVVSSTGTVVHPAERTSVYFKYGVLVQRSTYVQYIDEVRVL